MLKHSLQSVEEQLRNRSPVLRHFQRCIAGCTSSLFARWRQWMMRRYLDVITNTFDEVWRHWSPQGTLKKKGIRIFFYKWCNDHRIIQQLLRKRAHHPIFTRGILAFAPTLSTPVEMLKDSLQAVEEQLRNRSPVVHHFPRCIAGVRHRYSLGGATGCCAHALVLLQ